LYFSWYAIQRYETLNAYTADLSLIDQAMWNTLHGHFMEATWGDHQQPRFAEHVELILIPLSAFFWIWDDVRILLIVQAYVLAVGGLPVYWLAKQYSPVHPLFFVMLYLFSPPLQASAVADFHADPFVVTPYLLTFWYATRKSWRWMWFWAIIVMMCKENMPTLLVMLGMYLFMQQPATTKVSEPSAGLNQKKHAIALIIISVAWFAIATFGIVAPLARVNFGTDVPVYLANRFSSNPIEWLTMLTDINRMWYLTGLLLTTGGLALFAPHYLLLGLPIIIANMFSNFAGQYSGEQHYSAPLVPIFIIAAIHGTKHLAHIIPKNQTPIRGGSKLLGFLMIVAFGIASSYHYCYGWTPLSRRAETYSHDYHTRLLPHFLKQIPAGVPISASAGLHPHVAHRHVAYTFPTYQESQFIFVDVTDVPGVHPNEVKAKIDELLSNGKWHVLSAIDGFILMERASVDVRQVLPPEFYSFAKAKLVSQKSLDVEFDEKIKLTNFSIIDEPFHEQTAVEVRWHVLQDNLADDMMLWVQFYDDFGQPLNQPLWQPMIETLWYPSSKWQKDEIIMTKTLPQDLGDVFHVGVGVGYGHDFPELVVWDSNQKRSWLQLGTFRRGNWSLEIMPPTPIVQPLTTTKVDFEKGLSLMGYHLPHEPISPDDPLIIILAWQIIAPIEHDYTIFIHVINEQGQLVAQHDSTPFWVFSNPTTNWQTGNLILDSHKFEDHLPDGKHQIRVGLYTWGTVLESLPLISGEDSLVIGTVYVLNYSKY